MKTQCMQARKSQSQLPATILWGFYVIGQCHLKKNEKANDG